MNTTKGLTLAAIAAELVRAAGDYPVMPDNVLTSAKRDLLQAAIKNAGKRRAWADERAIKQQLRALEGAMDAETLAVIRIGSMTIRCRPYRESVLAVAAKYAKPGRLLVTGAEPLRFARPSLARPKDADALLAALEREHGECSEAMAA
jgi:hypothetical protein